MISSKNAVISFKQKQFQFEDFCNASGLKKSSARNLISELVKINMITMDLSDIDKRKRYYTVNWKYIVDKLKHPNDDYEEIINLLDLSKYDGKHVLLKNFEVLDNNDVLMDLLLKYWDDDYDDEQVIVTIGIPKDVITFEFGLEL
ncbi:MAG: hypothetical protein HeimC3_21830 [Candidatus Heimdallarchaeota archaeon LC_3]|nr:MAG: hypothetical protein HeimC3_21830 [Candidatus Heimdallarchaeota archaeon LC_3]